jgi:hypothetical protein
LLTSAPPETGVLIYEGEIVLPTYPYQAYLTEEADPIYGMPVQRLDRAAYEAAAPGPSPQPYRTLVLENAYLRLTFLPELGGRLYSARLKATDQEIFYHNPVVKPSRYGPLLPMEDNWWLAVGGIEWDFPVQEHGYAWGRPWTYTVDATPEGATVTLRDSSDPGRVRAEVDVSLPAGRSTFSVQPRLINGTDRPVSVQFWLNAVLAPGSASVDPNLEFIVPAEQVLVHSRGQNHWSVPEPRSWMGWPAAGDRDLRYYARWSDYLGFFAPSLHADFMAVYSPAADLAVARITPAGRVAGHKLFAFGPHFADRSYTDDNTQYIEMWGGVNASFWPEDDLQLAPGASVEWHETWWALAGLGGLTFANDRLAFHQFEDGRLRVLAAREEVVTLVVTAEGRELARNPLALSSARPVEWDIPAPYHPPLQIRFFTPDGELILDYSS